MAAIFTAADISGLSTSVSAVLVSLVGVALLFVAYRYLRKAGIK
jgi:uncharacterized membrane protein